MRISLGFQGTAKAEGDKTDNEPIGNLGCGGDIHQPV